MENGGNVVLTNQSTAVDTSGTGYADYDVAFDAIAFVPMGGTPGQPIGGPPTVQDEPAGSNPALVNCGCVTRTAGDPVNTVTGWVRGHLRRFRWRLHLGRAALRRDANRLRVELHVHPAG
jgi:hypothetical protein